NAGGGPAADRAGSRRTGKATVKRNPQAPALEISHRRILGGYALTVTASDVTSGLAGAPSCTDNGKALPMTKSGSGWTATVKTRGGHTINCSVSDVAGWKATSADSFTI